jgi:hypothetical protein
MERVQ